MAAQKTILEQTKESRKTWNFKKGNATLNFTLRVDIQQDMKDFVELLERSVEEVKKEIEATKK